MQGHDAHPEKYYLFKSIGGGLACEGYSLLSRDTAAGTLRLVPDLGGGPVEIEAGWLDRPRGGELWSADSSPDHAYAKMLGHGVPDGSVPKKPPECFLALEFRNGTVARFPVAEVVRALGKTMPAGIRLGMERGGIEMHASVQPGEAEYPGITVDASTRQAGEIWLGGFELPSECYPARISARLYAGCGKYETDEPIAIATHEVTDDARVMYRAGKYGPDHGGSMHKLVYVDYRSADTRPWLEASEEAMPEHREDEALK